MIPSVNFHLVLSCNMKCKHCFAANISPNVLTLDESGRIVRMLAQAGFEKINFAGGEPMLYPNLDMLIRAAKDCGMTASMVTNGSLLTSKWLRGVAGSLDWIAVSIDSDNPVTHAESGRAAAGGPMTADQYLDICADIKRCGIRLKINTVVTSYNHNETMSGFIANAKPERWKIMQVLYVQGQNDYYAETFGITDTQFEAFLARNTPVDGVRAVPEDNRMMRGSYAMVDPRGRFFDNTRGAHTYSKPILQAGVMKAYGEVNTSLETFRERGGFYDW